MRVDEVGDLTPAEFTEFLEFQTNKRKEDTNLTNHAVLNALINIYKDKNKPFVELFPDKKEKTEEELFAERYELFGY